MEEIMTLENKLNLTNEADLAREEEKKSKIKAKELFETGYLDNLEPGTFKTLSKKIYIVITTNI